MFAGQNGCEARASVYWHSVEALSHRPMNRSERVGSKAFRVGHAEMQGRRPTMEDAHVIHAQDTWGFFGVFDGHGGAQCSEFIAKRINEELAKSGMPKNDKAVTELAGAPVSARGKGRSRSWSTRYATCRSFDRHSAWTRSFSTFRSPVDRQERLSLLKHRAHPEAP